MLNGQMAILVDDIGAAPEIKIHGKVKIGLHAINIREERSLGCPVGTDVAELSAFHLENRHSHIFNLGGLLQPLRHTGHSLGWTEKIIQRIRVMHSELDQRSARALFFIPPPLIRCQLQTAIVGKIALGHDEFAQTVLIDHLFDLAATHEAARTMAYRENDAGLAAGALALERLS